MTDTEIVVPNFTHKAGDHCESTTLRDHLNYLGYALSEAMVFGLDATMGFSFWETPNQPEMTFIGGKQGTLTDKNLACRLLGVVIEGRSFTSSTSARDDAISAIQAGKPLLIQADLGFLPYFKWPEGAVVHFGGHTISLVGISPGENRAWIFDNNYDAIQEIRLEELERARNSREGPKFLWPQNVRYLLSKRPDGKRPPLEAALKLAIGEVVKHMLAASMNNVGLAGFKTFLKSLPDWKEKYPTGSTTRKIVLENLYNYIEEYGTGGSLFRKLYLQFLEEIPELPEVREGPRKWSSTDLDLLQNTLIPSLRGIVEQWGQFTSFLKLVIDGREELDIERLSTIGGIILDGETAFFSRLKELKI